MRINARDFITSPFLACPRCGKQEYGVLGIRETRCERRCRSCWYTGTINLPKLRKKVIYIDQFGLSNIMKVLSEEVKGHKRAVAEPLWRELFEILCVLCNLELIVCPDSQEHQDESLTSPFREALERTYQHFSRGVSFNHGEGIRIQQVLQIGRAWVKRMPARLEFDAQAVTHGSLHGWTDRILVHADSNFPGAAERLRAAREQSHAHLAGCFDKWRQDKKTFQDVFSREKVGYRESLIKRYLADCKRRAQMPFEMLKGQMPTLDEVLPSEAENVISSLQIAFRQELQKEHVDVEVFEFLKSTEIDNAPFSVLSASLFASLAVKAAAGQKVIPNRGTFADINIVSNLLPYCDAMFVDNKCRALLCDIPKTFALPYKCNVFSPNTGAEFLSYLRNLRDSVSPEHVSLVEELYGPNPMKPHSGISGVGAHKRAAS
jgi:hypothetical protein